MTDEDLTLLKSSIDEIVILETSDGEEIIAQVLFVFDEGETPDLFYLKVVSHENGTFTPQETGGHSLLLSEVVAVRPLEA